MARTEIMLPVRSATLTDDSDGSAIPEIVREVTTDTTDPQLAQFVAKFDDSTLEHLFWQFRLPVNYRATQESGFPKIHVQFYMADDQPEHSRTVYWCGSILALTPRGYVGDPVGDDDEMTSLKMQDGSGWVANNGATLNHDGQDPSSNDRLYEVSIDMHDDADSAAAGDYVIVGLRRDVYGDNAEGDACVVAASLEYTVG